MKYLIVILLLFIRCAPSREYRLQHVTLLNIRGRDDFRQEWQRVYVCEWKADNGEIFSTVQDDSLQIGTTFYAFVIR